MLAATTHATIPIPHQINCEIICLAPTCCPPDRGIRSFMLELYNITSPSDKSAATQKARVVTAAFINLATVAPRKRDRHVLNIMEFWQEW